MSSKKAHLAQKTKTQKQSKICGQTRWFCYLVLVAADGASNSNN
jgi:hypothetical protein